MLANKLQTLGPLTQSDIELIFDHGSALILG